MKSMKSSTRMVTSGRELNLQTSTHFDCCETIPEDEDTHSLPSHSPLHCFPLICTFTQTNTCALLHFTGLIALGAIESVCPAVACVPSPHLPLCLLCRQCRHWHIDENILISFTMGTTRGVRYSQQYQSEGS